MLPCFFWGLSSVTTTTSSSFSLGQKKVFGELRMDRLSPNTQRLREMQMENEFTFQYTFRNMSSRKITRTKRERLMKLVWNEKQMALPRRCARVPGFFRARNICGIPHCSKVNRWPIGEHCHFIICKILMTILFRTLIFVSIWSSLVFEECFVSLQRSF